MAIEMTDEALQQWYERFSKELWEKAKIDVTQKDDLGRVKNFHINAWKSETPFSPDVSFTYAYVPSEGTEYVVEMPSLDEPRPYFNWLLNNLEPEVTMDQIRQLYEMSRKGTLMVTAPGEGLDQMRQVHTDHYGNITTSLPVSAYRGEGRDQIPEDQKIPERPAIPEISLNAEEYGLKAEPKKPEQPANMNPGFLSWLGYLLGMDTDYARKVRYEKDMEAFETKKEEWDQYIRNGESTAEERFDEFRMAQMVHEDFRMKMEVFKAEPLGAMDLIATGFKDHVNPELDKMLQAERRFLLNQHARTPREYITKQLDAALDMLDCTARTDRVIRNLLGCAPDPGKLHEWIRDKVFIREEYQPDPMALPENENVAADAAEQEAYTKKWSDLADIANFAALSDPAVSGNPVFDGFTSEETSALNYTMILCNVITHGRPDSMQYMAFLEPARVKGMEALRAYHAGDPEPLAKLLAHSIRQTNQEVACLTDMTSKHAVNTCYLVGKMLQTLESDANLMDRAGLTKSELEEARGNVALYQVAQKAMEGRRKILEYAAQKQNLSPDELKQAGEDVLFANVVSNAMADAGKKADELRTNDPAYMAAVMQQVAAAGHKSLKEELDRAIAENAPDVADKEKKYKEMLKEHVRATHRINLLDLKRPSFEIGKALLKPAWVKHARAVMAEKCGLDHITTMDRSKLGMTFGSNEELRKAFPVNIASGIESMPQKLNPEAVKNQAAMSSAHI